MSKLEMKDVYTMCVVIVSMAAVEVKDGAVYIPLSYMSSIGVGGRSWVSYLYLFYCWIFENIL